MEDVSINVLVDAKTEYTKQLTNILTPLIFEGFTSLYEEAVQFKDETQDPRYEEYSELQIFQDYLRKIPKWNQDLIDDETKRIITKSKCEWLEDLLAAVFISNAKILSVIRIKNPTHQMKLKIPKLRNFIHKCYVECSREIYQNVYLFDNEEVSTVEKQKNVRDVLNIIRDGIVESVRKLLPVQEIIKTYLGKIYDDEETENTLVESGFEEGLFREFAQNKLRKSIDEVLSDNEKKSPKRMENTSESSEEDDEEEENEKPQQFQELVEEEPQQSIEQKVVDMINNVPIDEQTQEVRQIPNIDEIIKIKEMPETPVQQILVSTTNEDIKTIQDKIETFQPIGEQTDNSLTQENVKKIFDEETRQRELRRKEKEERHRVREERHRIREERRARKRLLRNKDKMAMEVAEREKVLETPSSEDDTESITVTKGYTSDENQGFSFYPNAPEHNEEEL